MTAPADPSMTVNPIRLWDGPAPGSELWTHSEQPVTGFFGIGREVRNVVVPTLTAYVPDGATGRAVLVLPGGAMQFVSMGAEGDDVGSFLMSRGVAAFVLKYRVRPTAVDEETFQDELLAALTAGDTEKLMGDALAASTADAERAAEIVARPGARPARRLKSREGRGLDWSRDEPPVGRRTGLCKRLHASSPCSYGGGFSPWRESGAMDSVEQRVDVLVSRFSDSRACLARLLCDDHDPDAVAFVLVSDDFYTRTLTYGALREQSERVAAGLVELGVGSGDAVATLMGKGAEYLATVLAIGRLGAVHVPLFTAFAPPAISMRLDGAGAKVIVTDSTQRSKLDALEPVVLTSCQVVNLRATTSVPLAVTDVDFEDLVSPDRTVPTAVVAGGRAEMIRMYTSGTTGRPKGVAVPVAALATWQLYIEFGLDVTDDDVFWCAADPGWAYGLFTAVLAPMAAGRTSIMHADRFTPEATWRILSELRVTNFAAAPTAYRAMRVTPPTALVLRKASSAGEPLTPEVNEWASEALGLEVHDHYGQTELGMVFCNHHHPALKRPIERGSMGRPLPGWAPLVLRADSDEPASSGELGRVAVDMAQSPTAWFQGYVDAPDATAAKFAENRQWYLTGDAGRVDDAGNYSFTARDDDVIIMAGYRIGPFDVESIVATHPAVNECAVIAVPDDMKGEVIELFVVLKEPVHDVEALAEELKQRVRDNLAAYAYPRSVHVVEALPKTPSGKIQRFVLREQRRAELGER